MDILEAMKRYYWKTRPVTSRDIVETSKRGGDYRLTYAKIIRSAFSGRREWWQIVYDLLKHIFCILHGIDR